MPALGLTGEARETSVQLGHHVWQADAGFGNEAPWWVTLRGLSSVDRGAGVGGPFLWIREFGPVGMVKGEKAKGQTAFSRSQ